MEKPLPCPCPRVSQEQGADRLLQGMPASPQMDFAAFDMINTWSVVCWAGNRSWSRGSRAQAALGLCTGILAAGLALVAK